jgi:Asp/Glu/hydantoin racemase
MPRICLIHAVRVAIDPVAEAFARLWPEAELMNLLDDSLSIDRQRDGMLTPAMMARFLALGNYANAVGVDGILFTCSAFGPAIEAVKQALAPLPVLKPNEAMFEEALGAGARLGLLASFEPSIAPMMEEFAALAKQRQSRAQLVTACAPEAMPALNRGDTATHDALLAREALKLRDCEAIMLAQFSTARARTAVHAATGVTVMTSPDSAVRAMRAALRA